MPIAFTATAHPRRVATVLLLAAQPLFASVARADDAAPVAAAPAVSAPAASPTAPAAPGDSISPILLPGIVVTPTLLPTPIAQIGSSVTVITAAEIERKQERTLPDALQDVPGLNVVQTGGPGGATQVYIRGTNANQVKVLIDGVVANDPSQADGSFDFAHILTSDIARIEILRGPQSGLYGADAIGGVINIITKTGSGPPHITGSLEGGSFGTFNQTAGVSGSVARFNYAIDAAHYHSADTPVTPADLVPAGRPVNTDSYDNKTASTRLGANLTDNFDVGLVARYVDTKLDTTSDDFLGPEALRSYSETRQLFTRGTAHWSLFDGRFDQTVGLAYTDYHTGTLDPNDSAIVQGNDPADYHGDRVKFDWQGNITLVPGEILTLGAEHQLDQLDATTPVTAQVANSAGYAQIQSNINDWLFNALSLRYDGNSQFGGKTTFHEAPAVLIAPTDTKLKGSVGTGFKPPSLVDLYENFPQFDFFANPDLRPETSLGYDFGFEQNLLHKQVQFGATYFHNDITNLIAIDSTGTTLENVGKATTHGVESFIAYQPWQRLTLRGDYTFTLAEDDIAHAELERRPKNKASASATIQVTPAASVTATVLYVGPWIDVTRDGSASGVVVNGYTVANLAGSYDLGHGVSLFARINNLLDRHYQDPLGFLRPGLGIFGGIRVSFDALGAPS